MDEYPPLSCICLTYGRPELLEEAIYSFLQQDYPGVKELVVLNDFDQQTLVFDHPEVRVFNLSRRFRTVGEKMNAAAALCSHDLLLVWDDDDIYLPHRLSFSVRHFEAAKGFFKPGHAWLLDSGQLSGPFANVFHVGCCYARRLFDAVGGYPPMGNGYDQAIETWFETVWPGCTATFDIRPEDIYYLYRWGGTGSYHMSSLGRGDPGQNQEQGEVGNYVAQRARAGKIDVGRVHLVPQWRADYLGLVRAFCDTLRTTAPVAP